MQTSFVLNNVVIRCLQPWSRGQRATLCFLALLAVTWVTPVAFAQENLRYSIVQPGDTFATISSREFGSSALGRLIAEKNDIDYDKPLTAGLRLVIPVAPDPQYESAEVVFTKGDPVLIVRGNDGQERLLQTGHRIFAKDVIQTGDGGFVSLLFPAGTTVNIQPGSKVGLLNLDCLSEKTECLIELDAPEGNVVNRVHKRDGQPVRFKVNTPHASAAVRGTIFDVDASSEALLLGVTDGEVDIDAQGVATALERGLGARTLAGQNTETPVPLLSGPSFLRMAMRVSVEDPLAWYALDRAVNYWVAISSDAEAGAVVRQETQQTRQTNIPELDAGTYYLTVRAIDGIGLKGFSAVQELNVVALDANAETLTLQLFEDSAGRWVTAPSFEDENGSYEIQMSFSEQFVDVTSVDVGTNSGMVFQPAGEPAYVRARLIVNEQTVGPFGPVLALPAE